MLQRVLHGADRLDNRPNGISRACDVARSSHRLSISLILLVLLVGLPFARPAEEPQETSVAMVFDGTAEVLHSRGSTGRGSRAGHRS